jgi:hypothetical protein
MIAPGNELEFLLYKKEEPMDPRKHLLCNTQ